MKNSRTCDIENTVTALQEAIEKRKAQIRSAQTQSASPSPVLSHVFSGILNRAGGSYGQIGVALEHGGAFAQDFIKKIQKNVEEKPWDALRKAAVYGFGIGLFLSLRHKKRSAGEKE